MLSDKAKDLFRVNDGRSIDGRGVRIGVLSNSFNTKLEYNADIANLDLPPGIVPLKEFPYGQASDEGRAILFRSTWCR